MGNVQEFMKNLVIVIFALYVYFAVLFIIGFFLTWVVIRISTSVFEISLTDLLIYTTAGFVFTTVASIDLYLVGKNQWSPAMVLLSIPFVMYIFIKSVVKKTSFTFDTTQTPRNYKELDDSFKNIFKPIRKHF